jgi:hypothetical protein
MLRTEVLDQEFLARQRRALAEQRQALAETAEALTTEIRNHLQRQEAVASSSSIDRIV